MASAIFRSVTAIWLAAALQGQTARDKRVAPVADSQRQSFERQPKVAVLVGIGAYPQGSGLAPLRYAAADVRELAAELEKAGYSVRQLADEQATRGVVVRTLNQIGGMLDPDEGTLIFYFSGHGFAQNGANYLATYGATVDDLEREGLPLTEVEQLVKKSRAKRQVLWVDACRNDPQAGTRDASRRAFGRLQSAEGLRVLYSTRSGSVSYEDDGLHHGVFTYFLLRGLRGEAAGGDGLVTFQDLAGYVSESVMNYSVKSGRLQRPFDAGEASGDFLLAQVRGTVPVLVAAAPPGPVTAESTPAGGNFRFNLVYATHRLESGKTGVFTISPRGLKVERKVNSKGDMVEDFSIPCSEIKGVTHGGIGATNKAWTIKTSHREVFFQGVGWEEMSNALKAACGTR